MHGEEKMAEEEKFGQSEAQSKRKKQNGKESGEVIRGKEAGFERKELKFREKENSEENLLAA